MARIRKKAQDGNTIPIKKVSLRTGQLKRLGKLSAKNPERAERVGKRIVERRSRLERGKEYLQKNVGKLYPEVPAVQGKKGVKVAKKTTAKSTKKAMGGVKMMKSGGSRMKKCRGGCY